MGQSENNGFSEKYAYITVLTNEKYIPGVIALKKGLAEVGSCYDLVILLPKNRADELEHMLKMNGVLDGRCRAEVKPPVTLTVDGDYPFGDHYWNSTFFKLAAVSCTEYSKVVLLDSDMLILDNIDDLFAYPSYSAVIAGKAVHPEWEDLNSGLMVFEPDMELYNKLIASILPAVRRRMDEGLASGDQDVFQQAFPEWRDEPELHIPEKYNMFFYELCDLSLAGVKYDSDVKVIHFIGSWKPWSGSLLARENAMSILRLVRRGLFRELSYYLKYYYLAKG